MLVILHGWSDSSRSFRRLGKALVEAGVVERVAHVRLGDYVSMDDEVEFSDLTKALDRAWQHEGLSRAPRSVDVVVHSTGGLVIRDWMTATSSPDSTPIRRLLMLAPANFGSPLAHKGRSFIGRIFKGYASDKPFQTGTKILKGLELASPYAWELAHRDLFGSGTWYGPGRVLCTVLVGSSGYTGISAAANANGTDGTVRVSSASLSAEHLELDFSGDPQNPSFRWDSAHGRVGFTRLNAENHSTVAMKDRGPRDGRTFDLFSKALTVTDAGFDAWCDELDGIARSEREAGAGDRYRHGYQNTVVHLIDDQEGEIDDFFFELFAKSPDETRVDKRLTAMIQTSVETVHSYQDNSSYRSLLIDTTVLDAALDASGRPLFIAVTAMPDIGKNGNVGYSTFGYNDIGSIKLTRDERKLLFRPDRTVLTSLRLRRMQGEKLFQLSPLR